jgi:hypothetical protein
MIVRMMRRTRPQQRYAHRLRDLGRQSGVRGVMDVGVPQFTARGCPRRALGRCQSEMGHTGRSWISTIRSGSFGDA